MSYWAEIKKSYRFLFYQWKTYWHAYGGWKALAKSPYLHFSLLISFACFPVWNTAHDTWAWYDISLSVIPNVLGFSLGGYAILLAFGNENFLKLIAGNEEDDDVSPYMQANACFIHFIVMQFVSLVFSVIARIWELKAGYVPMVGFMVFCYAIMTALAAAFAILELAGWFDMWADGEKKPKNETESTL